jgi:hypothetical protein
MPAQEGPHTVTGIEIGHMWTCDGDAEEVMKVAEVRHGELRAEFGHDVLKKSRGRHNEGDVVNVDRGGPRIWLFKIFKVQKKIGSLKFKL